MLKSGDHLERPRIPNLRFQEPAAQIFFKSSTEENSKSKKPFPKGMIFHSSAGFHSASNFSCRLPTEIGLSPLLKNNLP